MPIFEYKCNDCGAVIELLEKNCTNEKLEHCPVCDSDRTFTKQFSTFAAQSSGSAEMGPCGQPHGICCGGGHCGH
jgi:putative FmdB family regulatory protein